MFNTLQSDVIVVKKYKEAHKVGKEIQSICGSQGGSLEKGTPEEKGRLTERPPATPRAASQTGVAIRTEMPVLSATAAAGGFSSSELNWSFSLFNIRDN